jgi:hypothetical protein
MSDEGFVYFLAGGGFIKIGFSTQPDRRWEWIRGILPFSTEKLGVHPGTRRLERALHVHFADFHVRQEWFLDHPDIRTVAEYGPSEKIKSTRVARVKRIEELIRAGENFQQIGTRFGLSRERIRQIAVKNNLGHAPGYARRALRVSA